MTIQTKVDEFFAKFPMRKYKRGETFIQVGDKPKVFYVIEGTVAQYDTSSVGDKLVLNIYKPGSFLPLSTALNNIPSEFAFEANDHLTVRVASNTEVVDFLESSPEVVMDALKRISRGSNGLFKRLAAVMEGNAEIRIVQELEIMQQRFDSRDGVAITEVDLAAQTGLARETVSRAMKRLREKEIITRVGGKLKLNQ